MIEYTPETYTTWLNPLSQAQIVKLILDDGRGATFTAPPGGEVKIPSRYDQAVQKTYRGRIIAGLAPQLVRVGASEPDVLAPALDTEQMARAQAEAEIMRANNAKLLADQTAILASAALNRTKKDGK